MDIRSLRDAGFISRFLHILILMVAIGIGVHFKSPAVIGGFVAAWFVLYAVVYLVIKPHHLPASRH
jgi:hypothetical protein